MADAQSLTEKAALLNQRMQCPMGMKQVYIHGSILRSSDAAEPPEIRLRCKLRTMRGDRDPIRQDYIEKVCARDPMLCPVYQIYRKERGED